MEAAAGLHQLIEAHYQALYRYAFRLSGSAADAEDLTQEAFGKALVRLSQLRDPNRAKAWLYKILRNAYLHRVRDRKRHRVIPLDAVGDIAERPAEELPDIDPEQLQAALNDLDETFRTPIILYYFEDFSYRDIADQMELPIGTVMSRLARGKGYLRSRLSNRGDGDSTANDRVSGPNGHPRLVGGRRTPGTLGTSSADAVEGTSDEL